MTNKNICDIVYIAHKYNIKRKVGKIMDNKTKAVEGINREIQARENVFLILGDIDNCLKKFHGKKYSKRIDTALKKIDKNLKSEMKWNNFSVIYEVKSIYEYNPNIYVVGKYMENVNNLQLENTTELIKEARTRLQKELSELKEQIENFDKTMEKYETMQKEVENFNKNIHWSMRQYADIGYFENRR